MGASVRECGQSEINDDSSLPFRNNLDGDNVSENIKLGASVRGVPYLIHQQIPRSTSEVRLNEAESQSMVAKKVTDNENSFNSKKRISANPPNLFSSRMQGK